MRKDFDTGQSRHAAIPWQLYTVSHKLIAFSLCVTLLGTLFMQSPTSLQAAELSTEATSTTEYPLSENTSEEIVSDSETSAAGDTEAGDLRTQSTTTTDRPVATTTVATTGASIATASPVTSVDVDTAGTNSTSSRVSEDIASTTADYLATTTERDSTEVVATTSTSSLVSDSTVSATTSTDATSSSATTTVRDTNAAVRNAISTTSTSTGTTANDVSDTPAENSAGSVQYARVDDDTMMQFDRTKCTAVADGSYYCQTTDSKTTQAGGAVPDGVHALPDSDGDLEIFLVQNGDFTQLTFNTVDDAAPHFDPISNTVVWHRSVADRYQIMVYELASATEQQLTNDEVNNMQPVRSGDYIAWQRWVDNNWQIMLYDGDVITQLTQTSQHSIAPVMRSNYLLWKQQRSDGRQTVEVYDLLTKQQYSINDPDGGAISNPRMMLLYESEFDNGDVVTRGLDIATNEVVPIAGTPVPLPENIPNPEPLDEVRALVSKTVNEDDDEIDTDIEPVTDTDTSSSTIEAGDIVMTDRASTTLVSGEATSSVAVDATDSDYSLDLRGSSTTEHVTEYDIFVAPFVSSSTATTTHDEVLDAEELPGAAATTASTSTTQ